MRAALIAASILSLGACNMAADAQDGGKGYAREATMTERSFNVGSFDSVALGGHHNVVVRVGPAASVRAEGDEEEIERMKIEVRGDTLHIGTKKQFRWNSGWGKRRAVTVYVTAPRIEAASIGGSGDIRIDRIEGDRFAGSIGGSGDIQIDSLRVGEADFSIAGSGGVRAVGSANRAKVSIAGSGDVDLTGLEAREADVSIVGSGDVKARATESADVSIMGSGDVTLTGGARCSVNRMGSGSVRCG